MNKGSLDMALATLSAWIIKDQVALTKWIEDKEDPTNKVRRYTCRFQVPWSDCWIGFDGSSEAPLKVEGVPYFGINPFHSEVMLPYREGEAATLELERVRTGLMGVTASQAELGPVVLYLKDKRAESAYYDLLVLREWSHLDGVTQEERSLLETSFSKVTTALSQVPLDVEALKKHFFRPNAPAEEEGVRLALMGGEARLAQKTDTSLKEQIVLEASQILRDTYDQLHPLPVSMGDTVVALGHAHIDLAWLWRYEETRRKVLRTFSSQIRLLRDYGNWRFLASTPQYFKDISKCAPLVEEELKSLVTEQRLEPAGAFWVESDCQLVDGPSLIRQLTMGIRWFKEHFGHRCKVAFLPDTFGFSSALPTLLRAGGIDLLVTTKLNWNDTNEFEWTDFAWVGPDGSSVEVQLYGSNQSGYNANMTLSDINEALRGYRRRGGEGPVLYTFGHGDGGGGPEASMLERLKRYKQLRHVPEIVDSSLDSLVKDDPSNLPKVQGDLYLEYHRGVFSSQSQTKRLIRRCEQLLVATELWQNLLHDDSKSTEFEEMWETLLRADFHDIIPGSSISSVYRDIELELTDLIEKLTFMCMDLLADKDDPPSRIGCALANTSQMRRPAGFGEVELRPDQELLINGVWQTIYPWRETASKVFLPSMEPFEIKHLQLRTQRRPSPYTPVKIDTLWRKTVGPLTVEISPSGINSLVYEGRSLLQGPSGVVAYRQHPDAFDAWEIVPPKDRVYLDLDHGSITLIADTDDFALVSLSHTGLGFEIEEKVAIESNPPRIHTLITSKIRERRVVLAYNVVSDLIASKVTRGNNLGIDELPTLPADRRDLARFEWPAQRLIDITEFDLGIAIFNRSRFGHSINGRIASVTLATSPLNPDPFAESQSESEIALFPHLGNLVEANVVAHAYSFDSPVLLFRSDKAADKDRVTPLLGLPEGVVLLGCGAASDGSDDKIFYVKEIYGARRTLRLSFIEPVASAWRVSLVEKDPVDTLEVDPKGNVFVVARPNELVTLKVRFLRDITLKRSKTRKAGA
ncbi:alpha-mannosidase [Ferrithrix thermotolerans DSM 19514]|uniref:Alpha-mannosidase n=1 Tax=Ferrithrix thermotolerans DSM 19514 TaxID=1121881 RepID=A0A1M4XJ07_9ACTN|nr:alpha-mannosidase [Ferrithrix thermotolerans]SHE93495.1 alpha-mannosidase [Ferrithrix thermotolerans DSM 19514]